MANKKPTKEKVDNIKKPAIKVADENKENPKSNSKPKPKQTKVKPEKEKTQVSKNVVVEQLIMEGVEPPIEPLTDNTDGYTFFTKKKRRTKQARILTKEEMGIREKKPKKRKRAKIEEVARFAVDIKRGLTSEQVETRRGQGFTNKVENKNVKTYKMIFFSNLFTFFNFLCFLITGALIYVGSTKNLMFMVTIVANIAIGIVQEIKAKKTIEKISLVTTPVANVVRDGIEQEVSIDEVVLDDIIMFSLGKQICADSIIQSGEVEVNESLLTGESVAVKKKKGEVLLAGSFIVSGKCVARVNKVGSYNYTAQLAAKAKQYEKPKSELLYSMKFLIKVIGVFIIPLGILTFNNTMKLSTMNETVVKTAGSVIGMIPAGMFLLTSLALAVGVIKLAKKRTLVQDLYSIEMLARIDVLCLDKTGTITDGTMKVSEVITVDKTTKTKISDIFGSLLTALDDNNQTSRALATHFGYSKELTAKTILPFSSSRKYSAVTFKNGETYAFGAPEFIYKNKDANLEKTLKLYASKGFRVLLLVKSNGEMVGDKLPQNRIPVAIIVIEDHIRDDAHSTIQWFKENGVAIKIISGDNPITVSEVSKRVGVANADKFISLEGLNDQQVIQAASKYTVFGRVSPEQKLLLVKTLKNKGHKVAMTGDGVNDILALKEADCSIAMASGSEAARHVSNLVLLDSNFGSMPSVVAEGRRVVNNIQKSSSIFLMKTIFTIILTILCLIIQQPYPFSPNQMLLLEWAVIGIPTFFLALQPNTARIKGRFLPNLLRQALPAAILLVFNVVAIYVYGTLFDKTIFTYVTISPDVKISAMTTMASLSIVFTGLLVLYRISKPIDVFRGILWAAMVIFVGVMLTFVPFAFFEYISLSITNVLVIIVLVQLSYPVYNTIIKVINRMQFGEND